MTFVVTGTGRSGTSWIAAVLNAVGVKTGHENVYGWEVMPWEDWQGDASLNAIPLFALGAPRDGIEVVHLTRHPCWTLASIYHVGLGWVGGENPPMHRWLPDLCTPDEPRTPAEHFERLCEIWCRMIDAAEGYAEATFRIEDLPDYPTAKRFMAAIGHPFHDWIDPFWTTDRTLNHQRERDRDRWLVPTGIFPWRILPDAVTKRAATLGYKDPWSTNDTLTFVLDRLAAR